MLPRPHYPGPALWRHEVRDGVQVDALRLPRLPGTHGGPALVSIRHTKDEHYGREKQREQFRAVDRAAARASDDQFRTVCRAAARHQIDEKVCGSVCFILTPVHAPTNGGINWAENTCIINYFFICTELSPVSQGDCRSENMCMNLILSLHLVNLIFLHSPKPIPTTTNHWL